MQKEALRKKYGSLRSTLSEEELESKSMAIANQALQLPIWDYTYYHIFLSIQKKKEINTEYLLHILHGKDKSICIPKADFKTFEMEHILLQENTPIKISAYGIPEPVHGISIDPKQLDVVFVPLLAFDTKGNRVGYGKGFYDRFLAQCKPSCLKIGLSLFEAEEEIVYENIDFPLNHCITPAKIYSF
ncbi:MAG TPA: 5-formyltetrahydrofolate cyclo-ligase [Flavobacteriaceae bacterium]|nr:5-formyltetrahydrofolate cyclo-ligase [Flavobacteriaceae bacterium]HBR53877.1 5-formyltetrahydrofolate cyclo-ligase [Flavobacteriaceae bacterium]